MSQLATWPEVEARLLASGWAPREHSEGWLYLSQEVGAVWTVRPIGPSSGVVTGPGLGIWRRVEVAEVLPLLVASGLVEEAA